jgi:polyvinyl alcohol dehydrogenase (cytochrome)
VPGIASAITVTGNLVLAPGTDGWLRIRDARTGRQLWSYDTTTPVTAVGGAIAKGGAMGGGVGPVAYHGMLIMPSGYGFTGKIPGNALFVWSLK